jgi:inner membrane protein
MASLGHIAFGMAGGRIWTGLRRSDVPSLALARSMVAFSALSLAPDMDVIAFRFGIPYSAPWGHRGAAHSFCIALVLATIAALATRLTPEQVDRGQTRTRLNAADLVRSQLHPGGQGWH